MMTNQYAELLKSPSVVWYCDFHRKQYPKTNIGSVTKWVFQRRVVISMMLFRV